MECPVFCENLAVVRRAWKVESALSSSNEALVGIILCKPRIYRHLRIFNPAGRELSDSLPC